MAKTCTVCGKGSHLEGKRKLLRGHYNFTAKKRKYPNLQWIKLSTGKRVKACTQCMKKTALVAK
ncbi:MAG: hypothetical protein HYV65_03570 [Candidatus Spechtbacteria bacterium]|nr:hypothetical protein [Candidatus Spechtbacteria bacterium]